MEKEEMTEVEKKQLAEAEKRQEETVINARELILPILKSKNLSVDQSKLICDLLAIAIQQGQFELLKEHKVSDLKLLDFISDEYPQSETVRELLGSISGMNMLDSINSLQWMVAKMNKIIEDENKLRKFEELKLDF